MFFGFQFPGAGLEVLRFRADLRLLSGDGLFPERQFLRLRTQRVLERRRVALDAVSFRPDLRLLDCERLAERFGLGPDARGL